jgi:hypothetical protein
VPLLFDSPHSLLLLLLLVRQMFPMTKADGIQITCEQMVKQCQHQGGMVV